MQEKYYFWENTNTNPALNLAIEQCLLEHECTKENAIFMLWQNAPAVIIGRHQNAFEEVDMPFLEENAIALVRRHSGGGAVYHDLGNINFTFIIPSTSPKIEFAIVLNPMLKALETLGINASLSGRNDILVENKKISGAAQSKGKHAILVHGTLLVDVDMGRLEHVLAGNPDKYQSKGIASIRSRVTNIKELLQLNLEQKEVNNLVKQALIKYFVKDMQDNALALGIIQEVEEKAAQLAKERYANDEWTLMKSPPFSVTARKKFPFGAMRVSYNVKNAIIQECKIEGDFFAIGDIASIENAFRNISFINKDIQKVLDGIDFAENILNAPRVDSADRAEINELFLLV